MILQNISYIKNGIEIRDHDSLFIYDIYNKKLNEPIHLEITFKTDLIKTALTHSSFSSKNYERLEFLGDSILDFLIADILYKNSKYKEDQLTRARAFVVSEENLSQIFDKLNISPMVKLGKSCKEITKAIKCDIVESIVACIYWESGLEACNLFIIENFDINAKEQKDYKTQFQEFAQHN